MPTDSIRLFDYLSQASPGSALSAEALITFPIPRLSLPVII